MSEKLEWVVVLNPGERNECVQAEFARYKEAAKYASYIGGDVMRRMGDGTLTTEF